MNSIYINQEDPEDHAEQPQVGYQGKIVFCITIIVEK